MPYNFAYKHFSVISKVNYNNMPPDLNVPVGLILVGHLHSVFLYNYSFK